MVDTIETAGHFIYVTQVYLCYSVVIWKTRWNPVKIACLFCRCWVIAVVPYLLFAFIGNHTEETCKKIFRIPVALAMWNQVSSESVLLIRTYAFFNHNNCLLAGLICALSGVVTYQLYIDTSEMMLLPFVKPPYGPCFPASKPRSAHLLGFFVRVMPSSYFKTPTEDIQIAPLLFDIIVTAMTVWKTLRIHIRSSGPSSKIIQTFLREGVFYYILISIANLINGIFYLQPRQIISALNIPLSVMMASLLACRLILDFTERGAETVSHSEGVGICPFTTKCGMTLSNDGHPVGRGFGRPRQPVSTMTSNVILGTIGSESTHTLKTLRATSSAPAYNSFESGFMAQTGGGSDTSHCGITSLSGIRADVEKTMSAI
ncbi:hypothetical protein J3A83DRAFT_4358782 [Scleroderma citrinum]